MKRNDQGHPWGGLNYILKTFILDNSLYITAAIFVEFTS